MFACSTPIVPCNETSLTKGTARTEQQSKQQTDPSSHASREMALRCPRLTHKKAYPLSGEPAEKQHRTRHLRTREQAISNGRSTENARSAERVTRRWSVLHTSRHTERRFCSSHQQQIHCSVRRTGEMLPFRVVENRERFTVLRPICTPRLYWKAVTLCHRQMQQERQENTWSTVRKETENRLRKAPEDRPPLLKRTLWPCSLGPRVQESQFSSLCPR